MNKNKTESLKRDEQKQNYKTQVHKHNSRKEELSKFKEYEDQSVANRDWRIQEKEREATQDTINIIKSSTRSWASLQFGGRYRQDKKAHRSECIDRIDGRGLPLRLLLLHRGPSTMRNAVLTLLSSGLRPPLLLKDQIVARPLNRIAKFAETAPNLHARRHVRVSAKFAQPAPPCSGLQIAFPVPTAPDRPSASSSHSSSSRCCCQHCLNCPLLSSRSPLFSPLLSSLSPARLGGVGGGGGGGGGSAPPLNAVDVDGPADALHSLLEVQAQFTLGPLITRLTEKYSHKRVFAEISNMLWILGSVVPGISLSVNGSPFVRSRSSHVTCQEKI